MKPKPQRVENNLGLVCITVSDAVRYKTITRKRLLSFDESQQEQILRELYTENTRRLEAAISFCLENGIRLYRMTSQLFPFSDELFGLAVLTGMSDRLREIGRRASEGGIRLVLHPDQFVVLSSDSEAVIANSVKILTMHANTMDMLEQPRSEWAAMTIHGGKADRADKMVATISELPESIRNRIVLENDEYAYSSGEILDICKRSGVPMVFDAHHHVCHEGLDSFDHPSIAEAFWAARDTWTNPANQMVHISNGRTHFNDRAHSDLISTMPEVFRHAPWIEVEAKHKELALTKLKDEWR
ncbi:MAG TPA: UV DNA damage repair endonuclease UvsE, partial [Pyrinomonadaceae bacterium]|nr:UV DNA damage repair endonuclease UvsE [Pyrinomonadaceae bacterium]